MLLLSLVNGNPWTIYIMNWLIFLFSFWLIKTYIPLLGVRYLVILMINPIVFSSLLAINKEIISLLAISLLVAFTPSRNLYYGLSCLSLSIMVRWQFSVAIVCSLLLTNKLEMFRNKRWIIVLCFTSIISFIYPLILPFIEHIDNIALEAADVTSQADYVEGLGTYPLLLGIQRQFGGYLLVVIPKTAHLLFGLLSRYNSVVDFTEFYNTVIQFSQALIFFFLIPFIFLRRKFDIAEDSIYLAILYCVIFALTPIYSPRYLFPVYVLCAITISKRENSSNTVKVCKNNHIEKT